MKRFKSARQAQQFLSVHDQVANLFHIPFPEFTTADFRRVSREQAFAVWREISKDKRHRLICLRQTLGVPSTPRLLKLCLS